MMPFQSKHHLNQKSSNNQSEYQEVQGNGMIIEILFRVRGTVRTLAKPWSELLIGQFGEGFLPQDWFEE